MNATAVVDLDVERKAFENLRAGLAFCGFTLARSNPADGPVIYTAGRWGLMRELKSLREVADFAQQVGAR